MNLSKECIYKFKNLICTNAVRNSVRWFEGRNEIRCYFKLGDKKYFFCIYPLYLKPMGFTYTKNQREYVKIREERFDELGMTLYLYERTN